MSGRMLTCSSGAAEHVLQRCIAQMRLRRKPLQLGGLGLEPLQAADLGDLRAAVLRLPATENALDSGEQVTRRMIFRAQCGHT